MKARIPGRSTLAAVVLLGAVLSESGFAKSQDLAAEDEPLRAEPSDSPDNPCAADEFWVRDRGCGKLPRALSVSKPDYPTAAWRNRIEGTVVLQGLIRTDGRIERIEVKQCDQPGWGLEEAAIKAFAKWKYRPATLSGKPVGTWLTVRIKFP